MKYFSIEPEVAGGWGKNTVFERTPGKGTIVHKLHYVFDGWLGDELLTSTPCFIVSKRLADEIEKAHLTGIRFDKVEVSTSGEFQDLHPDVQLPLFVWLRIDGKPGEDDFGLRKGIRMIVSQTALTVLQSGISHAVIKQFEGD
jgi:uncharacterized repeat protein (TIGR02543 family)